MGDADANNATPCATILSAKCAAVARLKGLELPLVDPVLTPAMAVYSPARAPAGGQQGGSVEKAV